MQARSMAPSQPRQRRVVSGEWPESRPSTPQGFAQLPADVSVEDELIFAMDELIVEAPRSQAPPAAPRLALPLTHRSPLAQPPGVQAEVRAHLNTLRLGLKGLDSPGLDATSLFDRADGWQHWTQVDVARHAHGFAALRALQQLMGRSAAPRARSIGVALSRQEVREAFGNLRDAALGISENRGHRPGPAAPQQTLVEQHSAQRLTHYFLFPLDRWVRGQRGPERDSDSSSSDPICISDGSSAKRTILRRVEDRKASLCLHIGEATLLPPIALYLLDLTVLHIHAKVAATIPDQLFDIRGLQSLHLDFAFTQLSARIKRLSSLESFNIRYNKMELLPIEVLHLSSVQRLALGPRSFGFRPGEGKMLPFLRELDITAAALNAMPSVTFESLNLESLTLHMSSRRPPLAPERIRGLQGLRNLVLYSDVSALPKELFEVESLQRLWLDCPYLRPNFRGMQKLSNLTLLDIGMLDFLEEVPPEVYDLPSLRHLVVPHPHYSVRFHFPTETLDLLRHVRIRFHTERFVS